MLEDTSGRGPGGRSGRGRFGQVGRAAKQRVRRLFAAAATVALAAGCGTATAPGSPGAVPPAWVPAPRQVVAGDHWLAAGEAASAGLPRTDPNVLFVGDSITEWWTRYGSTTWERDFAPLGAVDDGVVGDTTSNLLYRLESGSLTGIHPRVVVVLIGTNNIQLGQSPQEIVHGVDTVVSVLHAKLPAARLLVLGLLPRAAPGRPARRRAARVNALLADSPPPGVVYRDPGAALLRPGGSPASAAFLPGVIHTDLLHPTAAGYRLLGGRLLPEVRALLTATS